MKIAFDENMPAAMVRTFQTLAAEKRFRHMLKGGKIVSAISYTPKLNDSDYVAKSDVPWMRRFRDDGGRALVSGNTRMPEVPQELLAIQQLGLVAFFFPHKWNNWNFFRKSAFLLVQWERVIDQARVAKRGTLFRMQDDWAADKPLLIINSPSPLRLSEREHPVQSRRTHRARPRTRVVKHRAEEPDLLTPLETKE